MVYIKLVNFKNRHDSDYEIKDGKITLIRGPSGIGKSTLFHAIEWCLYGKLTGISNESSPKAKTSVTLSLSIGATNIDIYRQRNPGLLKLNISDKKNTTNLTGDAAQHKIYSLFGEEMMWHSSCYLTQGQRNWFFTASGKERKALLTTIAFGKINPEEIEQVLQTINDGHASTQKQIDRLTIEYEMNDAKYRKMLAEEDREDYSDDEIAKAKSELTSCRNKLVPLRNEVTAYHQKIGLRSGYESTIKQLSSELENLNGELDPEYVEQLESEKMLLSDAKRIRSEREMLTAKLTEAQQQLEEHADAPDIMYSQIDETLSRAKYIYEYNQKRDRHIKVCQALGIEYDNDSLASVLTELQQLVEDEPLIVEAHKWKQQKMKLDKMLSTLPEPLCNDEAPADPTPFRRRLEELTRPQNTLKCPHCSGDVKYQSGKLIACKVDTPKIDANEIDTLRQEIEALDKLNAMWKKYQRERESFDQLSVPDEKYLDREPCDPYSFSKTVERFNKVKQVKYFESLNDYTHTELYSAVTKAKALYTIADTESKLAKLADVTENKERLIEITNLLNAHHNMTNRKSVLTKELTRVTGLLQKIVVDSTVEDRYKQCNDRIAELTELIRLGENNKKLQREYDRLMNQYSEIETLTDRLLDYSRLLSIANDLEAESLKQVADSINKCLEYVIPHIFDDQISVQVDTVKVTKDGRPRPKVNLKITRNGFEVSDIKLLSGGEGDRISFALTLALNLMCNRKFLLLDETFSSIGDELKESAVEVIRKLCPNTTTCVIMHDGIEGIYDDILTI